MKKQQFTTAAYEAPEVEILTFLVERGFGFSTEVPEEDDDIIDF